MFAFYASMFVIASLLYLPQGLRSSYYDYVNNTTTGWRLLLFQLSMPAITISALQKRYVIALIGVCAGLALVLATGVRVFVLISVVPMLLILFFGSLPTRVSLNRARSKQLVAVLGVALVVATGTYVNFIRTDSVEQFPEESLTLGMYHIIGLVDGGIAGTGNSTLETLAKSVAFPIYNRILIPNYEFPLDPATYIAQIRLARPSIGAGFDTIPNFGIPTCIWRQVSMGRF